MGYLPALRAPCARDRFAVGSFVRHAEHRILAARKSVEHPRVFSNDVSGEEAHHSPQYRVGRDDDVGLNPWVRPSDFSVLPTMRPEDSPL